MNATINVEKGGDKNYWAYLECAEDLGFGACGNGTTPQKAIDDLKVALSECEKDLKEEGKTMPVFDFTLRFDIGSFFEYYPINITAFAKYIGMNASLLRQYTSGNRRAKEQQVNKISQGIELFSKQISNTALF